MITRIFLRHRGLARWAPEHPSLKRFKARRCVTLDDVRAWVEEEKRKGRMEKDKHGRPRTGTDEANGDELSVPVCESPCKSVSPSSAELVANAALSLLNLCCYFLDRQLAAQAAAFEKEGGFTERLYRIRSARRDRGKQE